MIGIDSTKQTLVDAKLGGLVVGFPKCGTTSFAQWLDGSPYVDVSTPKETFQLCPEFAPNLERSAQTSLSDSFASYSPNVVRFEATTLNVYSESLRLAVAELPDVKVIILTRDPVETVLSWHNQMKQAGQQLDENFQEAWNYSVDRRSANLDEPPSLHRYDQVCSHGHWTNLWIDALGHERILVLRDTELKQSPDELRAKVNAFFGRDMCIPGAVPTRNVFSKIRFPMLYRTLRRPVVKNSIAKFERKFPAFGSIRRYLRDRVFLKPSDKRADSQPAVEELRAFFAKDEALLKSLLEANRSNWSVSA